MNPTKTDIALNMLPPADLVAEIEKLNEEILIERERNLYARADFQNYRRRTEKDIGKLAQDAMRGIIISLLSIVDDMESALLNTNGTKQSFVNGMKNIHTKYLTMLESYGVTPFTCVKMPFDYNLHEAVSVVNRDDCESGTVVDELRRGYLWNGELLRVAQVRVAE
jgi:molecular chaperone GrpE